MTQTIAIYGASGFIGKRLVAYLLEYTPYHVRAVCRNPDRIVVPSHYAHRLERCSVDIFNAEQLAQSMNGVEIAVYLIHMMARKGAYDELEAEAAQMFGSVAKRHNLKRVIYMSGLGNKKDKLSKHLASRHRTGRILRRYIPLVIELRASMIVGPGSAAYEIMRRFVKRVPFQVMPRWAITNTQPISLDDAVLYIVKSIDVNVEQNTIVDIGGPDVMTYKELIERYAQHIGKSPRVIVFPYTPLWLASLWLNLFIPRRQARIGRQMAESLTQPMIVVNNNAKELYPDIKPHPIATSFS